MFGFDGFLGGLDNSSNLTGEASVYTNFTGHEIMYHVSTLLPYSPKDPQQVRGGSHACYMTLRVVGILLCSAKCNSFHHVLFTDCLLVCTE